MSKHSLVIDVDNLLALVQSGSALGQVKGCSVVHVEDGDFRERLAIEVPGPTEEEINEELRLVVSGEIFGPKKNKPTVEPYQKFVGKYFWCSQCHQKSGYDGDAEINAEVHNLTCKVCGDQSITGIIREDL